MADIDLTQGNTGAKLPNFRKGGVLQIVVDFALALAEKESALAAADVLQILTIPAGCVIESACISPITGYQLDSTAATLDLGDDSNDDMFVDGFDGTATTEGVPIMTVEKFYPAADTLDVTLQALTGTIATGKVLVSVKIYELTISDLNAA